MTEPSTFRAVVFRVGGLVCALPAASVREVLPPLPATRIPGVPAAVDGLVNVRGQLLTVIDGHRLVGRTRVAEDEGALLVLELAGRTVGVAVSQVLDFLELPASAVAPRDELPGVDARYVRGVGAWGERQFVLLDVESLVSPLIGS